MSDTAAPSTPVQADPASPSPVTSLNAKTARRQKLLLGSLGALALVGGSWFILGGDDGAKSDDPTAAQTSLPNVQPASISAEDDFPDQTVLATQTAGLRPTARQRVTNAIKGLAEALAALKTPPSIGAMPERPTRTRMRVASQNSESEGAASRDKACSIKLLIGAKPSSQAAKTSGRCPPDSTKSPVGPSTVISAPTLMSPENRLRARASDALRVIKKSRLRSSQGQLATG